MFATVLSDDIKKAYEDLIKEYLIGSSQAKTAAIAKINQTSLSMIMSINSNLKYVYSRRKRVFLGKLRVNNEKSLSRER